MPFVQTDVITCPHCKKKQTLPIYDLTEVGDVEGEFPHYCESCNGKFKVEFEFKCFIKTTPTEVE